MFGRNSIASARRAFAALAAAALVAGCGSAGSVGLEPRSARTPLPTPTPVGLVTPAANAIYLGIYANATHATSDIETLETEIGRTFALDMHYETWTAGFPAAAEDSDLAHGRIPVDSWNCSPTNAQIAAGDADLLIETRALAIKNFGRPVFLRYLWDMNTPSSNLSRGSCYDATTDDADGTFSATEFVAAWRHIHAIFVQEHTTNVVWVWCPSAAGSNPVAYYPGDDDVDWVGIDAYDPSGVGFSSTFAPIYGTLTQFDKPILVAETGELQSGQPAFFASAGASLQTSFPQIKGFMYFDGNATAQDWRLTSAGISSLATFGAQPYLSASYAP